MASLRPAIKTPIAAGVTDPGYSHAPIDQHVPGAADEEIAALVAIGAVPGRIMQIADVRMANAILKCDFARPPLCALSAYVVPTTRLAGYLPWMAIFF